MKLELKIAWKNLLRHKGKSLVIGVILFIGAFLMTIGNGVISGMEKGLNKNIVNSFTGDIVLVSSKQESDNLFLDFMGKAVEPLSNYPEIRTFLDSLDFLEKFLPIGKNVAMIINDKGGPPHYCYLLGVDFKQYNNMFPNNLELVKGQFLNNNETGMLLPTTARKDTYEYTKMWFIPKGDSLNIDSLDPEIKKNLSVLEVRNDIVLMGFNDDNSTMDIRSPIKGIVKFKALNKILGIFTLIDIESYRQCLGYFSAYDNSVELTQEQENLLAVEDENLDDLFSESSFIVENQGSSTAEDIDMNRTVQLPSDINLDDGIYNMVLLLIKNNISQKEALKKINASIKEKGINIRAISWKKAMGMIGSTAGLIKGSLFVFVLFLFFVAVIIIVNTLSMAALERTSEIGMMRAVGARKGVIGTMFIAETAILSFFFGGIGIIIGSIIVKIISLLHITTSNEMIQLLYGGDTFNPLLTIGDIALSLIQLALVTFVAVLYPLSIAKKITPLDAISRE